MPGALKNEVSSYAGRIRRFGLQLAPNSQAGSVWKKLRQGSKDFEMLVFPPEVRGHHTPRALTTLRLKVRLSQAPLPTVTWVLG